MRNCDHVPASKSLHPPQICAPAVSRFVVRTHSSFSWRSIPPVCGRPVAAFLLQRQADYLVDNETMKQMLFTAVRHNILVKRADALGIAYGKLLFPKHNQWLHMIDQARWLGNPKKRSTYRNESLNGTCARVSRTTHRARFAVTVHEKMGIIQKYCPHLTCGSCL